MLNWPFVLTSLLFSSCWLGPNQYARRPVIQLLNILSRLVYVQQQTGKLLLLLFFQIKFLQRKNQRRETYPIDLLSGRRQSKCPSLLSTYSTTLSFVFFYWFLSRLRMFQRRVLKRDGDGGEGHSSSFIKRQQWVSGAGQSVSAWAWAWFVKCHCGVQCRTDADRSSLLFRLRLILFYDSCGK